MYTSITSGVYDYIHVQWSGYLKITGTVIVNGNIQIDGILDTHGGTGGTILLQGGQIQMPIANTKIIISPAAKLVTTIYNGNRPSFYMGQNTSIEVQSDFAASGIPIKGGILSFSQTDITNYTPSYRWKGIAVSGGVGYLSRFSTPCYHFSQSSIYPARATIDNCTISNSIQGICNYDFTLPVGFYIVDPWKLSCGGIIQVTNSKFIGNYFSLNWQGYQNWVLYPTSLISYNNYGIAGTTYANDIGFARNCLFTTNSSFSTYLFVNITGAKGVNILGNIFNDANHYMGTASMGIYITDDLSFYQLGQGIIDYACKGPYATIPCYSVYPSKISNLMTGVYSDAGYAMMMGNTILDSIRGTGIAVSQVWPLTPATILSNSVTLSPDAGVYGQGIVMANSPSGYRIEENTINIDNSVSNTFTWGIIADNNGAFANQIYKNTVNNLKYSMQANNLNFDPAHPEVGLKFFCNDVSNNPDPGAIDFSVALVGTTGPSVGISQFQGSGSALLGITPVANLFPSISKSYGFDNFDNLGAGPIDYRYHGTAEDPNFATGIITHPTSVVNTCPSLISRLIYYAARVSMTNFTTARQALEVLIDTTTPGLKDADGVCHYDQLLTQYSHLIDSTIKGFDYLDSLHQYKGDSMFLKLNIDSFLISNTPPTYTYDTTLGYPNDTISVYYPDSIAMVLDSVKYLYAYKLTRANFYALNNDFATAISTVNYVLSNYTLNAGQQNDLNNLIYLYGMHDSLANHGAWTLGSADSANIYNLALDSAGSARYAARGIIAFYKSKFYATDAVPIDTTTGHKLTSVGTVVNPNATIVVSPNPTSSILNITVHNYKGIMSAAVIDIKGRVVVPETAIKNSGTTSLPVSQLVPGTYIVRLFNNGKLADTRKIVKE